MMTFKKYFIAFFIGGISFSGYSQNKNIIVSNKIYSIYKYWDKQFTRKLLDHHLAGILPSDENFNFVSENSVLYRKDIISLIADKKQKKEIKYIALYTLQFQCEKEYRISLIDIYNLFKKKKVSEDFLISAIQQDDFSLEVIKNASSNEELKLFLTKLSKDISISKGNRVYIKNIISPNYYKSHKEDLDEIGERPFECK